MAEPNHHPPYSSSSSSLIPPSNPQPPQQQQLEPQPLPQYYYSPSNNTTTSLTSPYPTANPDPLLVTRVPKQNFTCFFLRYSTSLPAELTPYIPPADYAASIKRLNAALTCRSWVWTFIIIALCMFFCGAVLIGLGSRSSNTAADVTLGSSNNTTLIGDGGGNGTGNSTAPASASLPNNNNGNDVLLKIGIVFGVFAFSCLMFTFRRWRLGRAKELTNVLLIENSRYAQRRPVVRFRLMAGGWLARLMQRSAPLRKWQLQVEVCDNSCDSGSTDGPMSPGGQQLNSSYTVVNLPHSNVVRLRNERMHFPLRTQAHGPAIVDVTAGKSLPVVVPLMPMPASSVGSGQSTERVELVEEDEDEDRSETPQQPPPAYSYIEMTATPYTQPLPPQQQQQQLSSLPPLKPTTTASHSSHDTSTQSTDWPAVEKAAAGDGAVVMLSSQAAVVDDGKVSDYEERLRKLVVERTQQDEKMAEMQRELESMRATQQLQQQSPLVITLTDFSASSAGSVMRSLPPDSERQLQQSDGRLAVHTEQQIEGLTPVSNAVAMGSSRSGVVLLAGRRYSF